MKQIYMTLAIVMLTCTLYSPALAQGGEVSAHVTKLQQSITSVETASKKYIPTVEFVQPALIRYRYDEADLKGNKVNYVYEFNLSDIDPYAVRELTQKDMIAVVVAVKNKQKLVKVIKNEEVQSYSDEVRIVSKDIENARAISELVKKAIPPAEKAMANRFKLSGYDAMVTWMAANVKDVTLSTTRYNQTLTKGELPGVIKLVQTEITAKTSNEETYTFNLADINPNSIKYRISGNRFGLSFSLLQDAKYVSAMKAGVVRPYVNDILLNTNNVDEARDLKTVLEMAIPLATEKVKAELKPVASEKDGLERFKKLTVGVESGDKQISQELEPQCLCAVKQVEKDPKKTQTTSYKFNWIDVNPMASKIDVAGDRMFVELVANDGKKLIMQTVDEKFNGYEKDLKIYMPGIENARRAEFLIQKIVEKCKASYKEPFGNDFASTSSWILKNVKDVSLEDVTLKQTLVPVAAGKNDKLKFTRTELNAKGSGAEEIYELNLADINPLSVEVEVRGKWMYVSMETNFKGKIIKAYKDGKIQPYAARIEFAINDVDTARNMVSALKKAIKTIKP